MKLHFCFNFCKKRHTEIIALLENKKFGKGCFKSSEHIYFFPAVRPWWAALLGIHFQIFVTVP